MAITQVSQSTRDRIIAYLEANPVGTIQTISLHLGLTRADIRYHIQGMIQEKAVEQVANEKTPRFQRGRPIQRYRLTASARSDNLPALSNSLLSALLANLPEGQQEDAMQRVAEQMMSAIPANLNAVQRLNAATATLNQQGYHARWEAGPTGPRIILHHCPYAAVVANHPQMCTIDRYYLEQLTALPLQQTARIDLSTGKPPACIFHRNTSRG